MLWPCIHDSFKRINRESHWFGSFIEDSRSFVITCLYVCLSVVGMENLSGDFKFETICRISNFMSLFFACHKCYVRFVKLVMYV